MMERENFVLFLIGVGIALVSMLIMLQSCARPEVVVVQPCQLAELNPKSKLPIVEYIAPCPYAKCLDEQNVQNAKEREIRLRKDSNYFRKTYLDAKRRCEGND